MIKVTAVLRATEMVAGLKAEEWIKREKDRLAADPERKPRIIDKTNKYGLRTLQLVDDGDIKLLDKANSGRIGKEVRDFHGKWAADPKRGGGS